MKKLILGATALVATVAVAQTVVPFGKRDRPDEAPAYTVSSDVLKTMDRTISGSSARSSPNSGYKFDLNAANVRTRLINQGGWNQSVGGNDGRTGVTSFVAMLENRGNGDVMGFYANCNIFGKGKAGARHWLAQPACAVGGANVATLVPHSYLQGTEFNFNDNGVDAASIAHVNNFTRTENEAAWGEVWMGDRWQSIGPKAIDVGWRASGKVNVGLDLTTATADAKWNGGKTIAVNMAADQKIVLNSTARPMNGINYYGNEPGSSSISYNASSKSLQLCNNGGCAGLSSGGMLFVPQALRLAPQGFAALTAQVTCNRQAEGVLASITDGSTAIFNAPLKGGGSNHVMAYCNGTIWTVH